MLLLIAFQDPATRHPEILYGKDASPGAKSSQNRAIVILAALSNHLLKQEKNNQVVLVWYY